MGVARGRVGHASRSEAIARGVDVEACRRACIAMYDFMQAARAGEAFDDGAFITFLRTLLAHPEVLIWERFWLERNKDLDRELYGLVKWCKPSLPFGLNVWNRNHFNVFRRAQWPWALVLRCTIAIMPHTPACAALTGKACRTPHRRPASLATI